MKLNLKFKDLLCPACNAEMYQGTTFISQDVQLTKRCSECDLWMIIVIPDRDYDYTIERTIKDSL